MKRGGGGAPSQDPDWPDPSKACDPANATPKSEQCPGELADPRSPRGSSVLSVRLATAPTSRHAWQSQVWGQRGGGGGPQADT